jgi:RHS repeat-associated protein
VRLITNASGQVVKPYDYTAFGQPFPGDLDPETRRFAQLERTVETGNQSSWEPLDYAMARYYHRQTARFISPDSWAYADPLNPHTWNQYAYVMNNPLRWIDPSGHQGKCLTTICVDVTGFDEFNRALLRLMWDQLTGAVSDVLDLIPGTAVLGDPERVPGADEQIPSAPSEATLNRYLLAGAGVVVAKRLPAKPTLSAHKRALRLVHAEVGKLPKGRPGKFGSPQAGDSTKGYRLDPGHARAPSGSPESGPHFNWWDYTEGKRGAGGRRGVIPIVD